MSLCCITLCRFLLLLHIVLLLVSDFLYIMIRRNLGARNLWESKDDRKWGHDKFEEMTTQETPFGEVNCVISVILIEPDLFHNVQMLNPSFL